MLRETTIPNHRTQLKIKPPGWVKSIIPVLILALLVAGITYSLNQGSAAKLMMVMRQQGFPLDALLLEGAAGYSQPQRVRLNNVRRQAISLGMFLLTGVNVSDTRTFFLCYFTPPPQGPAWLGWAYNSQDPEQEGFLSEEVPENSNPLQEETLPEIVRPVSGKVLVGIYHTHNAESYSGDGGLDHQAGNNGEIVSVGETLSKALVNEGIMTVHSEQIHDAAEFMKAYSESFKTATQMLKDNSSIVLLLDIHRDGFPLGVNKSTVTVNGKVAAPILIVIGKQNSHWQKNEMVANELMALGEKKYPGLFIQDIRYAAEARYNQHLSNGALLLEIGSQMNTTEEAENAVQACAEIMADWINEHAK